MTEKRLSYVAENTYSTLNNLTSDTQNVWLVFHGLGYLSRYFIQYFKALDAQQNYIIAPQAPSKYYQDKSFKYVGASWLTKENTFEEMQNLNRYLDAVMSNEQIPTNAKIVVYGFSQGVSVAMRWLQHAQMPCDKLIINAGKIPHEIKPKAFDFLDKSTEIHHIVGKNDPYLTPSVEVTELKKIEMLFKDFKRYFHKPDIDHSVAVEVLKNVIKS